MSYFTLSHSDAVMPTRATERSAGYDLTAVSVYVDLENNVLIYDTGVKVGKVPDNYSFCIPFMMLCARSSIFKRGEFILANGVGIVDCDYPDTIKLIYRPLSNSISILSTQPFQVGEKIGQIILLNAHRDPEEIPVTASRVGGLGSTDRETIREN